MAATGSAMRQMERTSSTERAGSSGTATAPAITMAKKAIIHSGQFSPESSTLSPGLTPASSRNEAHSLRLARQGSCNATARVADCAWQDRGVEKYADANQGYAR